MDRNAIERSVEAVARELVERAAKAGLTVATAESCTAGLVASAIAGVPGASEVLRGGAVTYCDQAKHRVLGVGEDILDAFTAVSDPCARAMAQGARALLDADAAVSVTGYAGPGGGTADDPAGTVYLAVCDARGTRCHRCSFEGDRGEVRAQATLFALRLLLDSLTPM